MIPTIYDLSGMFRWFEVLQRKSRCDVIESYSSPPCPCWYNHSHCPLYLLLYNLSSPLIHAHPLFSLSLSLSLVTSFLLLYTLLSSCTSCTHTGKAAPSPAIGQSMGPLGLNMMDFCKQFNAKTEHLIEGVPVPVVLQVQPLSWPLLSPRIIFSLLL